MREVFNVKYEARIPCEGRPKIEHAWLEGTLEGSDVLVIHICEFRDGIYSNEATYLRSSELKELQRRIKLQKEGK